MRKMSKSTEEKSEKRNMKSDYKEETTKQMMKFKGPKQDSMKKGRK